MSIRTRLGVITLLSAVAATSCGASPSTTEQVADALDAFREAVGAPGATVAVRRPGMADLVAGSGDEAVVAGKRFLASSVTNTFVAALIHALVAEGQLRLDDPIAAWVPEVPTADRITLRQLLSHTSGLGDAIETAPWRKKLLADTTVRYDTEGAIALARPLPTGPVAGTGTRAPTT